MGIKIKEYSVSDLVKLFLSKIKSNSPSHFFEIGCFSAEFSKILSKESDCIITAFEANPYNYKKFKDSIEANGINLIHSAISNTNEPLTFKIRNGRETKPNNSILKREKFAEWKSPIDGYSEVSVNCSKLDEYNSDAIKGVGLWIDAEGVGYEVLEGAKSILQKTRYVFIEVEEIRYWENQKLDSDIISFMKSNGFAPIARDREYTHQYNIIFEKSE
jgi:FkbM family methyltransferase